MRRPWSDDPHRRQRNLSSILDSIILNFKMNNNDNDNVLKVSLSCSEPRCLHDVLFLLQPVVQSLIVLDTVKGTHTSIYNMGLHANEDGWDLFQRVQGDVSLMLISFVKLTIIIGLPANQPTTPPFQHSSTQPPKMKRRRRKMPQLRTYKRHINIAKGVNSIS